MMQMERAALQQNRSHLTKSCSLPNSLVPGPYPRYKVNGNWHRRVMHVRCIGLTVQTGPRNMLKALQLAAMKNAANKHRASLFVSPLPPAPFCAIQRQINLLHLCDQRIAILVCIACVCVCARARMYVVCVPETRQNIGGEQKTDRKYFNLW